MASSEPVKIIKLIEQMFPGVKLDAMEKIIEGVSIEGDIKFTKSLDKDSSVVLEVTVTPG